jgi:hypothetical protein
VRVTRISIALEQRLGDNDYGSERVQVEYSADLQASDDVIDSTTCLLDLARGTIFRTLSKSRTLAIRRKANPPARLCNECKQPLDDDNHGYYHEACEQTMLERRKREDQERRAQYEAAQAERQAEYRRQNEHDGDAESEELELELEDVPL